MSDRPCRERHCNPLASVGFAAGVLLGTGLAAPAVLAQPASGWVDPPPIGAARSPEKPPAAQPAPDAGGPAAPKRSTTPRADPSPALETEPAPRRVSRPRAVEPPASAKPEPAPSRVSRPRAVEPPPAAKPEPAPRSRLSRPKPERAPAPALARRAPAPVLEAEEDDAVAPAPRLARKRAVAGTPRPSFNCRYAKTAVEQAICGDPVLAAKDRRMALLYEEAGGSRYRPVDPSQWSWLAARNRCARARGPALETCVHRAYDARIAELSLQ
jgi:hypothetical protein